MKGILFSFLILFSGNIFANEQIDHFLRVADGVYRSGRPEGNQLAWAQKTHGIRTIINLENKDKYITAEARLAKQLGVNFLSSPMAWYKDPIDREVNEILTIMADPRNHPVLVHCHYGEDRTGLIIGLYRVLVQKWQPEDALKEMVEEGFHTSYWKLMGYFKKRTGLR